MELLEFFNSQGTFIFELILFILASVSGLAVRVTLSLTGQRWARTYSNTVTYLLLPVVGMVIVQLISTNIALSLGMIGALSIVRFRHPVKSPLELVIYFLLLTVGVGLATQPELGIALTIMSCITLWIVALAQQYSRKNGRGFPFSTSDGESGVFVEVQTNTPIADLREMKAMNFSHESLVDGSNVYRFAFIDVGEANALQARLIEDSRVESISTNRS